MTLEELKQKNAEAAAAEQEAQPDDVDVDEVQGETLETDDDSGAAEGSDEGGSSEEVHEWMQSDDQTSGKVPVKSHINLKRKLKGQIREKDSEIEQLRQEINQLKAPQPQAQAQPLQADSQRPAPMPKREDFYDKPDPDSAWQAALNDWVGKSVETRFQQQFQTHQQQQQRQQQSNQIDTALDQHYERAAQIVNEGLLSAEEYQSADSLVRQTVESISPGNGDSFIDALLARMGDGSEKVVVSLARNASNLNKFRQELQDDPTGISAAAFLGELRGKFAAASGRVSQTPRPGSKLKGDAAKDGGSDQRMYQAAHKAGNRQKAFDIKRAAKARGVDVKQW